MVYRINNGAKIPIIDMVVSAIEIRSGVTLIITADVKDGNTHSYSVRQIEKDIFLSESEAREALEWRRHGL